MGMHSRHSEDSPSFASSATSLPSSDHSILSTKLESSPSMAIYPVQTGPAPTGEAPGERVGSPRLCEPHLSGQE